MNQTLILYPMLALIGWTFLVLLVVLRSQAEPGRAHREVALRRAGMPVTDLVPAHERAASPARSPASPPPPASR